MRGRRSIAVILIIIISIPALGGTLILTSSGSDSDRERSPSDSTRPKLWIEMCEDVYNIRPVPGSVHLAQGKLHCEVPGSAPVAMIKVYLSAHSNYYNGSVYMDGEFLFGSDGGVLDFNISINPTPFDIAGKRYEVVVEGTWDYRNIKDGGDVEPDTFGIVHDPISNPVLSPLFPINDLTLKDHKWHEIRFILENKGNADDRITLTAQNIPPSLEIKPIERTYDIPRNNHKTVIIEVKKTEDDVDSGFRIDVESSYETPGRDPDIEVPVSGGESLGHEKENEIVIYVLLTIPFILLIIILSAIILWIRSRRGSRSHKLKGQY